MGLKEHAEIELEMAGFLKKDSVYDGMVGEAVLELIGKFADQGHSGMSAGIVSSLFAKLSKYEPLGPLTGTDDEWIEVGDGVFQNRRCSHVFKENGAAYDIDGKVFREPSGACFTSRESRTPVEFPYTPTTEYVDVPASDDDEN